MDQQLKERLVGAVVLMVAAVVFIPMILSGPREPEPAPAQTAAKPVRPPADFSSRIVPITPPAMQPPRTAPASPPAAEPASEPVSPPPAEPAPSAVTATPAPTAEPPAPRAPDRDTREAAGAAARSGWVVQLGSFSNARNAHALRDRLLGSGFAAFAESAGSGADAVTRVYVGPEPDRERAERHVAKLFAQTRLKGIVVRYPGE